MFSSISPTSNKPTGNIILIGMPGAGKSTLGITLAKKLSLDFVDTDDLIESEQGRSLQTILDSEGYLALRAMEETVLLKLAVSHTLIATGGSVIYSDTAMQHLKASGIVVFLDVTLETLQRRINNESSRGIARPAGQSFADVYAERHPAYLRYADIVYDNHHTNIDVLTQKIMVKQATDST